ncbi:unnamed protein product [Rotaria socialis]|uniref:Uncharacterized protein n=2 Tax=Rotaria socialis TaxID=392032 RepID=A0A818BLC6_9BILA|nr:unnamed protein product [Rotaria socialis]CAF3316265.1 unnamed protein product [Rotaria socialis]CAF3420637.1 unnamed protein product [Rotaria socialis]CAF3542531.1 unnamed protein product [Rotaria socialis]CAF3670755.1 unnamed protein product [Rotaria socialis]
MAQFTRFVAIEDKFNTNLFTFILPSTFLLGAEEKLTTREFFCRNIPFALTFVKNGDQLNAFLLHRSRDTETLEMTLDLSVTLLCREHFTRNESFVEKNCKFTNKITLHGRKSFTSINRLCSVDFMDERGNIQCELEIKNLLVSYIAEIQLPPHLVNIQYPHNAQSAANRQPLDAKIETPIFYYSNYEWCVVIQPKLDSVGQIGHFRMFIQRLTPCDHSVKLTYRVKLTAGSFIWDPNHEKKATNANDNSTYETNYTDIHGLCRPYKIDRVRELLQANGKFTLTVELKDAITVFPIMVDPFATNPIPVPFLDKDQQAWTVEAYIEEQCFIIRLYYSDIFKIPANYVRAICFNITVRNYRDTKTTTSVFQKPVTKYYSQKDSDEGLEISTTLDVTELTERGFLNDQQSVTIEIEMYFSHLMFSPEYSPLDDIVRKQKQQIMRELLTAQNENFQLEKKIHELQVSIQNPSLMSNRLSESVNGPLSQSLATGSSAPVTPNVVRKYYEMKYGDKGSTSNLLATGVNTPSLPMYNNPSSFDSTQSNTSPLTMRNGALSGKSQTSSVPQPNVTFGARNTSTFNLRNKLPNSLQNTLANTSQSLQSKLPASLQKLPASFTQGPTMNMLASKFQNAFS